MIKYSEATLSALSCDRGMIGVLAHASRPRATLYAALCLALSFTMGASLQSISLADSASAALGIPPPLAAAVLTAATLAVISGGREKIATATELVIPIATATYVAITLAVIFTNIYNLQAVLSSVLTAAITPRAAGGGILACLTSTALREGFARGILSNEAGAGTSSLAHTTSGASPVAAGLFGILEVFFDTVLLCPLTALAILTAIPDPTTYTSAMTLVCDAVAASIGRHFLIPLLFCVAAFAYSTVICWYYYGRICLEYLTRRHRLFYTAAFSLFIILGGITTDLVAVCLTDLVIFPMTLITLHILVKNADRIAATTEKALLPQRNSR